MWFKQKPLKIDTRVVEYASDKRMLIISITGYASIEEGDRIGDAIRQCEKPGYANALLVDLSNVTALSDNALGCLIGPVVRCSYSLGVRTALVAKGSVADFIRITRLVAKGSVADFSRSVDPRQASAKRLVYMFDDVPTAEQYLRAEAPMNTA